MDGLALCHGERHSGHGFYRYCKLFNLISILEQRAFMVLATFAFAEVVSGFVINFEFLGAAAGMPVDPTLRILVVAPIVLAVIIFSFYFMSTRFGLALDPFMTMKMLRRFLALKLGLQKSSPLRSVQ